jgi:hypothetical protein
MKSTLLLAALALTTSAALAQTTPATQTAPSAQSGSSSSVQAAGTGANATQAIDPTANPPHMDNMSSGDRKAMRKSKKMKSSDGTMKAKTKM